MSPDDVTRTEIYELVLGLQQTLSSVEGRLSWFSKVILLFIVVQVFKAALIIRTSWKVGQHLDIAARHGAVTDSQRQRTDKALEDNEKVLIEVNVVLREVRDLMTAIEAQAVTVAQTATESSTKMAAAVEQVPDKTANKVVERLQGTTGDSHHSLPAMPDVGKTSDR